MGIETLILKSHKQEATIIGSNKDGFKCDDNNLGCIEFSHLLSDKEILEINSRLLRSIADDISQNFNQVLTVEQKFTTDRQILAGITIDWRHTKDWNSFKVELEPAVLPKSKENSLYIVIVVLSCLFRPTLHILSLIYMPQNVTRVLLLMMLVMKFQMYKENKNNRIYYTWAIQRMTTLPLERQLFQLVYILKLD
jgi:hypothetical protein